MLFHCRQFTHEVDPREMASIRLASADIEDTDRVRQTKVRHVREPVQALQAPLEDRDHGPDNLALLISANDRQIDRVVALDFAFVQHHPAPFVTPAGHSGDR